ncbi:uncharacterized protein LOC143209176 isoform X2 [Lasioglossum baleicum]
MSFESRAIDEPSTSGGNYITEDGQMRRRNLKRSREENVGRAVSSKKLAKVFSYSRTFLLLHFNEAINEEKESFKKQRSILKIFNTTAARGLSQETKKVYQEMMNMRRKIKRYNMQRRNYKKRLEIAEQFVNNRFWETVPEHIKNMFLCYHRNMNRKECKRSFTLKEKIMALSIWKKIPKNYKFFQNLLLLPSTATLNKIIAQLDISPGICDSVFEAMKQNVKSFLPKEKYCILIFDEIQLSAGLQYNSTVDNIEGIYTDRNGSLQFADHATVWMLKGVYGARPWKQTVAFTYSNSSSTYLDITEMYTKIAMAAENIGLQVIASVCDQNSNNVKAINVLINNSPNQTISVNNREIIPLYDIPHLMKCIRNNLLTKDLQFSLDGTNQLIAKWEHIDGTYEIDRSNGPNRLLTKITDKHIKKECLQKMKVACCTQVFSATFAKVINLYANYRPIQGDHIVALSQDPKHTASLLLFINNLFDTLNNFYNESSNSTSYTRNVATWNEAIKVISSMKYIKQKPNDRTHPVVLNSWICTLKNVIKLNCK